MIYPYISKVKLWISEVLLQIFLDQPHSVAENQIKDGCEDKNKFKDVFEHLGIDRSFEQSRRDPFGKQKWPPSGHFCILVHLGTAS